MKLFYIVLCSFYLTETFENQTSVDTVYAILQAKSAESEEETEVCNYFIFKIMDLYLNNIAMCYPIQHSAETRLLSRTMGGTSITLYITQTRHVKI